jgi:hypothetical protein
MRHPEELKRSLLRARFKLSILRGAAVVVDAVVLLVQCLVQDGSPDASRREERANDWSELDVAMVEDCWDWALELYLVGLEAIAQCQ